jgi:hypothetical protein
MASTNPGADGGGDEQAAEDDARLAEQDVQDQVRFASMEDHDACSIDVDEPWFAGLNPGARIEFVGSSEPEPYSRLTPGARGTVTLIDDDGTIHVRWDDGSTLGLVTRPGGAATFDEMLFLPDRFLIGV